MGKPTGWTTFHQVRATRYLPGDPLQFELLPDLNKTVFGAEFTTNALGMRDRPIATAKPPGVVRIALLGASMDMGWGVETDQTYENRLEDWLNRVAERKGLDRRFEILNFSMAAYSPLHRLDAFRRKVPAFEPDLVLYAATRLDPRLLEIQLCNLVQEHVEPTDDFVRRTLAEVVTKGTGAGKDQPGPSQPRGDVTTDREALKARLHPELWPLIDGVLGTLAAECRGRGWPLAVVMVPRASEADGPNERREDVARYTAAAARHALPMLDLSDSFDEADPSSVEIAPWDDHPNAKGHELLFRNLARRIAARPELVRTLFGTDVDLGPPSRNNASAAASQP
jgi:hypothetical protein